MLDLAYLQLSLAKGIGPILARRIVMAASDSVYVALEAEPENLAEVEGIGTARAHTLVRAIRSAKDDADRVYERCQKLGVNVVAFGNPQYPSLLRIASDSPVVIFVRGRFEPRDLHAIGIVGSRKCSMYGLEQAERFGHQLAESGVTVMSGGARGVDTSAHKGAIKTSNGRTVAVLGCGVDIAYPPENADLFARIVDDDRGAVVSEFPPGTPPSAENFPRRNRIISGLSRGVVVIEADVRSGALITARQCVEDHNRQVFAVPGRVDNPTSAGPHKLIREGATLVTCAADILEALTPLPDLNHAIDAPLEIYGAVPYPNNVVVIHPKSKVPEPDPAASLTGDRRTVYEAIMLESTSPDDVVSRTGLEVQVVMRELTMLSMVGLVKRVAGNSYVRKK